MEYNITALCVSIKMGAQNYSMTRQVSTIKFSEILEFIAAQQRRPMEDIQELVLKCCGCQRRVWATEEEYQLVPVSCCRVRSLMLEEVESHGNESGAAATNAENISLSVSLPGGATPQPVSVDPSISIDALLKLLLQGRPRVPISDMRIASSGSLAAITGKWRDMTLAACGAANGDKMSVLAAAPTAVYIIICEPHKSQPTDSALVRLDPSEWSWRAIRRKAQRHFKIAISPHANASQFVRFCPGENGARRRVLWSYREEPEAEFYFADEDSGNSVDRRKAPHSVIEFLAPLSGLRWAKHVTPLLQVDTNCDYLCMSADDDGDFEEFDPQDTVFSIKWLVLVMGLRHWSSSGWQNYIRIRGGLIFHQQTGEEFGDIEGAVRSKKKVPHSAWRKFFLFMKEGDLLPRGKVPEGRTLAIYRREGLFLDVKDKRLLLRGARSEGTESAWTVPTDQAEFDEKFMNEMRQS